MNAGSFKRLEGAAAEFEDVREDIERTLTAMSQHNEYLRKIEEIRSQADIRRVMYENA